MPGQGRRGEGAARVQLSVPSGKVAGVLAGLLARAGGRCQKPDLRLAQQRASDNRWILAQVLSADPVAKLPPTQQRGGDSCIGQGSWTEGTRTGTQQNPCLSRGREGQVCGAGASQLGQVHRAGSFKAYVLAVTQGLSGSHCLGNMAVHWQWPFILPRPQAQMLLWGSGPWYPSALLPIPFNNLPHVGLR